ncbi:MAG: hypothetical protein U9N85_02205, partial [Bacteroidota bacterium]|nr:hypothetical protein [Bacteroidota bacterium]
MLKIPIKLEYTFEIENCNMNTLTALLKKFQKKVIAEIITQVLFAFAIHYMKEKKKPFECKCGNCYDFIWKTKNAKLTEIRTIFCKIFLPQMQVKCKVCGKKMFITRKLLEIAPRHKMSEMTEKAFAIMGSLTTFRVSEKIVGLFGVKLNKMAIWRCVQREGERIKFDIDPDESNIFEADGTGIPIWNIKKRGKELKVFIQRKIAGSIRIAGLTLGNYHGNWDELFQPLLAQLKEFKEVLLITDGDTSILKGLDNVNIFIQRCLWHIPHQAMFTMWEDDIERKSEIWYYILAKLYNITALPRMGYDKLNVEKIIKLKLKSLDKLIAYCKKNKYMKTATYLTNARPDMFTAFEKKMNGKTTSLVERVMRTVNLRINVGKWSVNGALNMLKIRLSYYYNEYDVYDSNDEEIIIKKIKKGG